MPKRAEAQQQLKRLGILSMNDALIKQEDAVKKVVNETENKIDALRWTVNGQENVFST
ncbi:unnamed protein product [Ectocarpus sp. 12 AP-2014]